MPGNLVRMALKPIASAARSFVGTSGLLERFLRADAKLDALAMNLAEYRSELVAKLEAAAPAIAPAASPGRAPLTKMEAVEALLQAGGLDYTELTGDPPPVLSPAVCGAGSRLCRQRDFGTDAFRYWIGRTRRHPAMHRKLWEWFFVADALWSRGFLAPGKRGLGFGVGTEPLTALFAALDCDIQATDLDPDSPLASTKGWAETNQHATQLSALHDPAICPLEKFTERVRLRFVDMNYIPGDLCDFDFTWSACSLEHLGSLRKGMDFFIRSLDCLRPGGVAVHTTEYNLSSNEETLESTDCSVYRRRDIEALVSELEARGHVVEPIDWDRGQGFADGYVDLPPYSAPMHLRLRLAGFDCTSIGLIVHARA